MNGGKTNCHPPLSCKICIQEQQETFPASNNSHLCLSLCNCSRRLFVTCLQKKERLLQSQGCLVVFFHLLEIIAQKESLLVVLQQLWELYSSYTASLRKSRIIKFISSNSTLILNLKLLQHKSTMGEHSFFSNEVSHATETIYAQMGISGDKVVPWHIQDTYLTCRVTYCSVRRNCSTCERD